MLGFVVEAVRVLAGLVVLLFLLYVPGAVTLNAFSRRRPGAHLFSGTTEWITLAVFISVLVAGGLGFVLAELGAFHWWSVLLVVAIYSLGAWALSEWPLRRRDLLPMLRVPAPYPQRVADNRLARSQRIAFLLLLVLAAVLFSRPAEMLRGALDSGVYVNDGVALGRTGSIFQRDIIMRQLNDDLGEGRELLQGLNPDRYVLARNRMPGFYVYDKKAALVDPQHYFLYPTWIGLLYTLFGIWGALYATPLLALLFVVAVYTFARRAFSGGAALLGMALLIACPVMIWFARYPVSEIITGLLSFIGFYAFMRMMNLASADRGFGYSLAGAVDYESAKDDAPTLSNPGNPQSAILNPQSDAWAGFFGVVAGVALGQIALARPDFIFFLAPVPVYLLYWRLSRTWQRPYTWFAVTLLVMLGIYAVHYFIYSYPYTLDLYHNVLIDLREAWRPFLFALYLGVIVLVLLDRLYPRVRPFWLRTASWVMRYRWAWVGALVVLVAAYVVYHYAIGPWIPNNRLDRAGHPIPQAYPTTFASYIGAFVDQGARYNLLRVGWYLSPLGIVVGCAGLLRWIWNRLDAALGLFLGSLLVTGFVFIQETYTEAHYIYTMRRYVPVILPALILGFAWACHWAWTRLRPRVAGYTVAALLSALLAVFFIYTGRVILSNVEEGGAIGQLDSLASNFPGKSIVLFSNERDEPYVVATPLQFIYGVESFVLTHSYPDVNNAALKSAVDRWTTKDGYKVYAVLGANGGKLDLPGYTLKPISSWTYDVPELPQLYYQKPLEYSRATLPWGIYSVEPVTGTTQPTLPVSIDVGGMDYSNLVAGFYIQEKAPNDASFWRWTGDHAIMRVPWPSASGDTLAGGKITLRLRPETPVPGKPIFRKDAVTVKIMLEGTQVGQVTIPPGSQFTDYTVSVPAGIKRTSQEAGTALLHIVSPTWSPQAAGEGNDARALGIQVDSVVLDNP